MSGQLPGWRDKTLFTPGPLTTSRTVKQAMLRDLGSRDDEFIALVHDIRIRLLTVAGVDDSTHTTVLMQGSGTFGIESVVGSVVPRGGKLLAVVNGAYGRRIVQIAQALDIAVTPLVFAEDEVPNPRRVAGCLQEDPAITTVAVVHCETSTGQINPVAPIGEHVRNHGATYIVDAMSSFGAVPLDLNAAAVDFLVSSANKCIEGVPGFALVIARTDALTAMTGYARSLSLDLLAQYQGLESNGQFRFTPPTHALLAFHQALDELEHEGGQAGRADRYRRNHSVLLDGMHALGFQTYLRPEQQGYIISSFRYPDHPNFDFVRFYQALSDRGHVIYPGKVSDADCFRIGSIGRIDVADVQSLLSAIAAVLVEMRVELGGRARNDKIED